MKKNNSTGNHLTEKVPIKHFLLIMRATFILLFTCVFCSMAEIGSAQNARVTINKRNTALKEVLNEIESQTDYLFIYNNEVNTNEKVSVRVKQKAVSKVLNSLLKDKDINYIMEGNHIILSATGESGNKLKDIATILIQQQKKQIRGTVVDETGTPVIGANIIEVGTTNGTITDIDGNFTLYAEDGAVIHISYIGYLEQDINTAGGTTFNIILQEDTKALEELVVIGYGIQKKVNLTGAVESIDNKQLIDRPMPSVTSALQGAVAGVIVQSGSGEPGNFATYKIRGNTSINSGGALVLVDGIPGDINSVAPDDIENISILKDAASAAIYGARAAEGVILITTKTGSKNNKLKVSYSANFAIQTPTRIPKSVDALTYAKMKNEAYTNAGVSPEFTSAAIEAIKDPSVTAIASGNNWLYTDNFDWIGYIFDNASQQTHNLNISNSTERIDYLFSINYLDQNGYYSDLGSNNFDKYNLRLNTRVELVKNILNLDAKINYIVDDTDYPADFAGGGGPSDIKKSSWSIPYITFIQSGPNMPIYDPNGNYSRYRMQANAVQALEEGGFGKDKTATSTGNFTLTFKPLKDLMIKAVGGYSKKNQEVTEWRRAYGKYYVDGSSVMYAGQSGPNNLIEARSQTTYSTGQLFANYSVSFGRHSIDALGGWSVENEKYNYLFAKRQNISGNELAALNLGSAVGMTNNYSAYEWALLSGFMRINYSFANKYLLEGNFRADGSSRFSSRHNKWGFFPSISVGWRVTEEEFMKDQKIFSNLKFRASYGELGNQNGLGYYDHIAKYTLDGYYPFGYGDGQWATLASLPSETRTWETVKMTNVAVDMGFLDNKLTMSAEVFKKVNSDMLVSIEFPAVIGISVPTGNYGELETKGWELTVGWQDKKGDFNYGINFNLTDQKDILTNYGVEFTGYTAGVGVYTQGYPLGAIFGYKSDGLFQSQDEVSKIALPPAYKAITAPGDIKYVDKDNNGKIESPNDLFYLGSTTPRYVFGMNLNAQWKNFDLTMLLQGVGKRNFYLNSQIMNCFRDSWANFAYTLHTDYWTEDNRNASMPRLYMASQSDHNTQISDYWMQNAAYIRLKNLQLGYTFGNSSFSRLGVDKFRIYFSGENLAEYSKLNKYFDPELTTSGGYMYPISRSYSLGINLTF